MIQGELPALLIFGVCMYRDLIDVVGRGRILDDWDCGYFTATRQKACYGDDDVLKAFARRWLTVAPGHTLKVFSEVQQKAIALCVDDSSRETLSLAARTRPFPASPARPLGPQPRTPTWPPDCAHTWRHCTTHVWCQMQTWMDWKHALEGFGFTAARNTNMYVCNTEIEGTDGRCTMKYASKKTTCSECAGELSRVSDYRISGVKFADGLDTAIAQAQKEVAAQGESEEEGEGEGAGEGGE